jgi:hypothetical protein
MAMNNWIRDRQQAAHDRLYITPAQTSYLRILLREAWGALYVSPSSKYCDPHHLETCTKAFASKVIGELKAAKERGWK